MKLLLINPRYPESFWSFRWAVREILPGKRAVNPPLGLATLAALCPPGWEVTIVDEAEAMVGAYEALYRGLLTDRNIATRIRNKLRDIVRIDSSVFHLVLVEP